MSKTIIFSQNLLKRSQEQWLYKNANHSAFEFLKSERISFAEKQGFKFGFVLKKIKKCTNYILLNIHLN